MNFPACQRFKNLKQIKINNQVKNLDENLIQDCENMEVFFMRNVEIEENFFSKTQNYGLSTSFAAIYPNLVKIFSKIIKIFKIYG